MSNFLNYRLLDARLILTSQGRQQGFSLVEMMIALALGLLISAAASLLFISGADAVRFQRASSELQNSAVFGLNRMVQSIRMAGNGTSGAGQNDTTPGGGIVLGTANLQSAPATLAASLMTNSQSDASGSGNQWTGASNALWVSALGGGAVGVKSDQLLIQYKAMQDMYDCEGNRVTSGQWVMERYFLRPDTIMAANESASTALGLACDAGSYTYNEQTGAKTAISGLGGDGQLLINRVDHMSVLLGVRAGATGDALSYLAISTYKGTSGVKPNIVSIRLNLLVRSQQPVKNKYINAAQSYTLDNINLLQLNTAKMTDAQQNIRRVYGATVVLMNGRGT